LFGWVSSASFQGYVKVAVGSLFIFHLEDNLLLISQYWPGEETKSTHDKLMEVFKTLKGKTLPLL
jgi:hypothetical protein